MSTTTLDLFQAATLSLARAGSIKDRLAEAFRNHLAYVDEDELPGELRDEFRTVTHLLTREPPLLRGEDSCRATVRKMSSEEAAEIASAVVCMFGAISRGSTATVRLKLTKSAPHLVPLYAAEA